MSGWTKVRTGTSDKSCVVGAVRCILYSSSTLRLLSESHFRFQVY